MDPEIKALAQLLMESQLRTDQSLNTLTLTVDR